VWVTEGEGIKHKIKLDCRVLRSGWPFPFSSSFQFHLHWPAGGTLEFHCSNPELLVNFLGLIGHL
jgi:hypothetical protein